MGQVMITRKPPHYLPEIPGESIFGISGNTYLLHYLSDIFGNLICNSFGAHSIHLQIIHIPMTFWRLWVSIVALLFCTTGIWVLPVERPSTIFWFYVARSWKICSRKLQTLSLDSGRCEGIRALQEGVLIKRGFGNALVKSNFHIASKILPALHWTTPCAENWKYKAHAHHRSTYAISFVGLASLGNLVIAVALRRTLPMYSNLHMCVLPRESSLNLMETAAIIRAESVPSILYYTPEV